MNSRDEVHQKIETLQSRIHEALNQHLDERPIAILDFPDIRNCGDSAIWLGEIAYIRDRHGKTPGYVSRMHDFSTEELERRVPEGPIFIHGGGNFGDIWIAHQDFRERILKEFPDREIVQFPQSIHFADEQRLDHAAKIIGRHRNFKLLVRDQESYDLASAKFDCDVALCPDMAFAIGPVERNCAPTIPVLAMLREDAEAAGISRELPAGIPVEDWITENVNAVRLAKIRGRLKSLALGRPQDWTFQKFHAAACQRFNRGVSQLSRAEAVVTDRLHVHIVSTLMSIPHAVLDNSYGKVRRFMSAFSGGTSLSFLPDSLSEGIEWAQQRARETVRHD